MCVVAFHLDKNSDYPFIFVGNRDELYGREAEKIHQWQDHPSIYGGRDLEHGGTWLGMNKAGYFSTLLNHPSVDWNHIDCPVSRGKIVANYLANPSLDLAVLQPLKDQRRNYQGFHFLFGNIDKIFYYSNINNTIQSFSQGIYSFSNTLDDLSNYRLALSKQILIDLHHSHSIPQSEKLIESFTNQEKHPNFVNYPHHLGYDRAYQASSLFIQDRIFGTVGTTAILVDKFGNVEMVERRYNPDGILDQTEIEFKINLRR